MKKTSSLILLCLLVQFAIGQGTQSQVPDDLRNSTVVVTRYDFDHWNELYIDSTSSHWIMHRDNRYKNYQDCVDHVISTFRKEGIKFTVTESRDNIPASADYLFDFRQVIVDNH